MFWRDLVVVTASGEEVVVSGWFGGEARIMEQTFIWNEKEL